MSPTPPPPIQQMTTNITSTDPYALMFLPPPARSTSDIFDHQYSNYPQYVNTMKEKSTFGTLPATTNSLGTNISNRYSYEGQSSRTGKARTFVYVDSSPTTTPPKLPRRTISTLNSNTNGHFTLSYMWTQLIIHLKRILNITKVLSDVNYQSSSGINCRKVAFISI